MSDLPDSDAHAPAPNDVSHCGLDALKHGEPTCKECGLALYKLVNGVPVHHDCPPHPAMKGKA